MNSFDAIVIGGGHNGLVNAAYLAKAGRRTVVLEQRPVVGGAAITEELHPGFWFTTFSYALSLLRPQVVEELDLVRHGFTPLEMPTSFAPGHGHGHDYLLMDEDTSENLRRLEQLAPGDADGYLRYRHDLHRVVELVRPLLDQVPPDVFDTDPDATGWLVHHLRGADRRVLHDLVRLVTGSVADFLDHYLRGELVKGWLSSSGIIGSSLGPMSPGSGLVLLYHSLGEHDGRAGSWSFHQGGNGGVIVHPPQTPMLNPQPLPPGKTAEPIQKAPIQENNSKPKNEDARLMPEPVVRPAAAKVETEAGHQPEPADTRATDTEPGARQAPAGLGRWGWIRRGATTTAPLSGAGS